MTSSMTDAMQSPSVAALGLALSKVHGEIKGAKKDSDNPFFKAKYADLTSVWDACREALVNHQLSVCQTTDKEMNVITTLIHSSGEWIRGVLPIKAVPDKSGVITPQSMGSAITYARRYALAAIVGVAPEDDDAEAAMSRNGAAKKPPLKDFLADIQEAQNMDSLQFKFKEARAAYHNNADDLDKIVVAKDKRKKELQAREDEAEKMTRGMIPPDLKASASAILNDEIPF